MLLYILTEGETVRMLPTLQPSMIAASGAAAGQIKPYGLGTGRLDYCVWLNEHFRWNPKSYV